ncbi:membrane protein [Aliivibrio wodanis]|uniref:Membrane protein n=1 Tax=Aliivibrio wodanis TaxID=80852 RepID=A0A090IRV0_9GAMM|nr:membrane protein [Aliivibrio wodanis]
MRRYVLLGFQWLNCLLIVLCPFNHSLGVDSATRYCLPQFLNHFTRKTCQCSRVASFKFSGGLIVLFLWLKVALGIFPNQPITLAVASLSGKWTYSLLVLAHLLVK